MKQQQIESQELKSLLKFFSPGLSSQQAAVQSNLLSGNHKLQDSPKGLMTLDCPDSQAAAFATNSCFGHILSLPSPAQHVMSTPGYLGYSGMPLVHPMPGALGQDDPRYFNAAAAYNAVSSSFVGRLASKQHLLHLAVLFILLS